MERAGKPGKKCYTENGRTRFLTMKGLQMTDTNNALLSALRDSDEWLRTIISYMEIDTLKTETIVNDTTSPNSEPLSRITLAEQLNINARVIAAAETASNSSPILEDLTPSTRTVFEFE